MGKGGRKGEYGKCGFGNRSGLMQPFPFPPWLSLCWLPVTESPWKCLLISPSRDHPFFLVEYFAQKVQLWSSAALNAITINSHYQKQDVFSYASPLQKGINWILTSKEISLFKMQCSEIFCSQLFAIRMKRETPFPELPVITNDPFMKYKSSH